MEFIWNDGGRAVSGFVGTTGDCVTRALAIATGIAYREIYDELGERACKTPRNGLPIAIANDYLEKRGWKSFDGEEQAFVPERLPKGIVIVHLSKKHGRSQHLCTLIDHVLYDTWNAAEDEIYFVTQFWIPEAAQAENSLPAPGPKRTVSKEQELTQKEFDRILRWLKALDKTASNDGSTEAEKRNALRMMQALMLSNNLTREDIVEDEQMSSAQFARVNCFVNGRRACIWEKSLAHYLSSEIFPTVQWFLSMRSHRRIFTFYGTLSDVQNCVALFRELLVTIATSAKLQYGGYSRGSGASYAEGYVAGLPRAEDNSAGKSETKSADETQLIQVRTLAIHQAARRWLAEECDIQLARSTATGRNQHDPSAERKGKLHGAQHQVAAPNVPKRLTRR